MAIVPSVLLVAPAFLLLRQQWSKRRTASTKGHETMRQCISKIQDILICNYENGYGQPENIEDTGRFLFFLNKIKVTARKERGKHMISKPEFYALLNDIHLLESLDLDVAQKRQVIQKMYQTRRFLWTSFR